MDSELDRINDMSSHIHQDVNELKTELRQDRKQRRKWMIILGIILVAILGITVLFLRLQRDNHSILVKINAVTNSCATQKSNYNTLKYIIDIENDNRTIHGIKLITIPPAPTCK